MTNTPSDQTLKEMYLRLAAFGAPSTTRKQLRQAVLVRTLKVKTEFYEISSLEDFNILAHMIFPISIQ
jgi:hypothetical protein